MGVNKAILITRPHHDYATNYLRVWSKEIKSLAEEKGIPVYDLEGKKSLKANLESYWKAHKPSFIFLNGHGDTHVITGHDNEPLVDMSTSLNGALIYARSCDAGQVLGSQLINNGARAFIGYKRKFVLGYSPEKLAKPREDAMAGLFLEPSNLVASTILKERTAQEAHIRSKKAMYRNFRKMVSSAASYEERYAARWLWSNLNNQVLFGDINAKI